MELLTAWYLSAILMFAGVEQPVEQHWQHKIFQTEKQCMEFVKENQIPLTDSILQQFRNYEKNLLKNFKFNCTERTIKGTET